MEVENMAYQAKRSKKVIEEFELVDENNRVVEQFRVELDAGSMVEKLRRKHLALVHAHKELQDINVNNSNEQELSEAYEKLGTATVDIIEAVFGGEDAEKILDFYENKYVDMAKEVIPFITGVVLPKLHEVVRQSKKDILSGYNRKQRRNVLKGMRK